MTLDIIVPHYKEPWSLCKYLFDSIAMQELVDWDNIKVVVVNDGTDVILDSALFSQYPYQVDYVIQSHAGVSATRNFGLDCATADYVMFCDADDGFLSNLALFLLFKEMQDGKPTMINPAFIEESQVNIDGLKQFIVVHKNDATYLHGKCYRRDFLVDNNIRFPDGANLHEDMYFNSLAIAIGHDEIREISNPLYLWRWNKDSVVRHENDFLIRSYPDLVEMWKRICSWMKSNGHDIEYKAMVCKFVISAFYTFQLGSAMAARNEKYLRRAERAVAEWYRTIRKDFYSCGDQMVSDYVKVIRADAEQNGLMFERIDLNSWLAKMDKIR